MMRHWNTIASALHKGEVYLPLLTDAELEPLSEFLKSCKSGWRTRTAPRTATTGLGASCGV